MSELRTNDLHIQPGASRVMGFSFDRWIPTGVTVSSVMLVEVTDRYGADKSAQLVISGLAVNGAIFTDPSGRMIPASRGCTATVNATAAVEADYFVRIKATFSEGGSDIITTKVVSRKGRNP